MERVSWCAARDLLRLVPGTARPGPPARGAGGRPGLGSRSGEQVVQIAVHAMVHHWAHQIKGALLGIARGAGVTEHVIGDAVHVSCVTLDHTRLLVVLGGSGA